MHTKVNNDFGLLVKAAREKDAENFSLKELSRLAILLDLDELFNNFPEKAVRSYRDELSGQPIYGRETVRNREGEIMYISSIPTEKSTRSQLYEGVIFTLINPAVKNLAEILLSFQPSNYAAMPFSKATAWAQLSNVLTAVKGWSKYVDAVISPGAIIAPMMGYHDTSNLLMLDSLIFGRGPVDISLQIDLSYGEFEFV